MNLKEQVAKAKSSRPLNQTIPIGYAISGYFEKGNKEESSWVGTIGTLDPEGHLKCDFSKELFHTIKWSSPKSEGSTPRGIKTWILQDGLYMASIVEGPGIERDWFTFAVVDGKREDLSTAQIIMILQSQYEDLTTTPTK